MAEHPNNADLPQPFLWGGMMLSQENGRLRYIADYNYSPDELRLTLKGWQLDNHGEQEMRIDEIYRVEFPDPAEMLLYDLEDVQSGEMEFLRLTLRRVASCL